MPRSLAKALTPAAALLGREAVGAYGLLARAGVGPGEPVVIVGTNAVAQLLVQIAVAKGVQPMVLCGEQNAWAERIGEAGALPVVVPGDAAPAHVRASVTTTAQNAGLGIKPWNILVTTANLEQRRTAIALCGPGSKLALLGSPTIAASDSIDVDLLPLLEQDAMMVGVPAGHPDLIPEVAALATRGDLDLDAAVELLDPEQLPAVAARIRATPDTTTSYVVVLAKT